MSGFEISPQVASFISKHIRSIGQLETLLLLQQDAPQSWRADRLARVLFMQDGGALGLLQELERSGLVRRDPEGGFGYAPNDPADAAIVEELRNLYNERRVTITTMIYARGREAQTFADSFVFRKKP